MHPTFIIAAHHLKRLLRNPGLILLLIAIPFTLAVIEYLAFGKTAAAGKLPPIQVLILDEDESFVSQQVLPQMFSSGPLEELIQTRSVKDRETARKQFQKNQASALLVFPEGLEEELLDGRGGEIQIYRNPIQTFSPQIVESVLEMLVLIANGLYGNLTEPMQMIQTFIQEERGPTYEEYTRMSALFEKAGPQFEKLGNFQELEIKLQRPEEKPQSASFGSSPGQFFAYIFPGLVIFALFFISQILAARLLRDRMRGMQTRLMTTPVSRRSILWGGILYLIVGLFLLLIALGIIAAWVFGIELRDPLSLLILALGLSVFISGLQLTITGMAKTDRGASFAAGVIIMLLALLGGSFMPAETYPPFLQWIAFKLPNGAAQQGFVEVLAHKRPLGEITWRIATTWIWAVLLLASAIRFEGRRLTT